MPDAKDTLKAPATPVMIGEPWTVGNNHMKKAKYRCECGTVFECWCVSIKQGKTKSCGCWNRLTSSIQGKSTATHGGSKTRLYNIWSKLFDRCDDPKYPDFHLYGGRGITICQAWRKNFATFRDWALANGYAENLSIDRFPNQNGNYCPENCRWATAKQQALNMRSNRRITIEGEDLTLGEWSERSGIKRTTIWMRIKFGWGPKAAVFTPIYTGPRSPYYARQRPKSPAAS